MISELAGAACLPMYPWKPQKKMGTRMSSGPMDQASSMVVLCEGLIWVGTPGRRRYLTTKHAITPIRMTKETMHTHRMNMNRLSVSAAWVELGLVRNSLWSHSCARVSCIIVNAPKRW